MASARLARLLLHPVTDHSAHYAAATDHQRTWGPLCVSKELALVEVRRGVMLEEHS